MEISDSLLVDCRKRIVGFRHVASKESDLSRLTWVASNCIVNFEEQSGKAID